MAATLKASTQGLKLVDDARNKKGWNKYDEAWSGLAFVSKATLKRFWQGAPITQDNFVNICDAVDLSWERVVDTAENHKISSHNCFAIIKQGVSVWNKWRESNYDYRVNLSAIDLRGYDLSNIDLRDVSLKGADLSDVNLCHANLSEANLVNANLSNANLSNTNLSRVQALGTNLTKSNLTGACLEDWNINNDTKLDNVVCDYIYLKDNFKERRPSAPDQIFNPGDLANLIQKISDTVDLIFSGGIDWQAFLTSFQDIQVEDGNRELIIQAIERKTNGAFVVRVEVPSNTDKAEIERYFWQKYNPILEAKDREIKLLLQQTDFYSEQIQSIRKDNTRVLEIIETIAGKENINYDLSNSQISGNLDVGNKIGRVDITINQKRTLAEAAEEIQNLLKQLEQTNPTATEAEIVDHINNETTPEFKRKALAALKAAGDDTIDKFLDNPYIKVGKAAIMGWMDS
ncbi:MAG: pentapeptide repeat-containing protein [Cyanobacteria bacterium P01_A01_bin.45]